MAKEKNDTPPGTAREASTTGPGSARPPEAERKKSITSLKQKLRFHQLPKPPPRVERNNSFPLKRSFVKLGSREDSLRGDNNGVTRSRSRNSKGQPSSILRSIGNVPEDADDDDDSTMEPRFNRIPHFPLSQSELDYIALTPIELVVQNLRESMMSDVPIHQLEEEPENWADVSWYMISISSPIIAASIGPLANLCSAASVADTWRSTFTNPVHFPADFAWIYALNGISLFVGVISNLSLYMNFTGLINHRLSQLVSIGGWYLASLILLSLIGAAQYVYFGDGVYRRYMGYWYGVVAAILYFIGATLLLINEIGRRLKKTNVNLVMTRMQSRLMLLNVTFIFWIGMGGGIYTAMIQGLTYGDAVYFCMGVCLTIAAGDILPLTHLSRTITIFYAYIGVFLIGLSIAAISSAIVESNGTALVYRRIESSRKKLYDKLLNENKFSKMKPEEAFDMLRKIHKTETSGADDQLAVKAILLYAAFLFLGAMAFHLIEGWSYFDGIYFCGLAFVANSFGDFTPKTPGGRTFFVVWAIGALPMMTILISTLGTIIFKFLTQESDNITKFFVRITASIGKIKIFQNKDTKIRKGTAKIHNLFFETEKDDTESTSNNLAQPVPNVRPGQPLFLRTASTLTVEESNESLFSGWPDSIASEGEEESDDAFNGDDETDDQPNNIAIPSDEESSTSSEDDDNINYADSEVLVRHEDKGGSEEVNEDNEDRNDDVNYVEENIEDNVEDNVEDNNIDDNIDNDDSNDSNETNVPSPPTPNASSTILYKSLSKIQTKRMLILTKQIRNLSRTLAQTPEQTYSYKEWVRLLKVIHLQIGVNTPQFWLSPLTPLRVPVVESCFFLLTSLTALDEEVAQVIHLQEGTTRPHKRGERVGYFQPKVRRRFKLSSV